MVDAAETVNVCEFCGGSSPMVREVTDGRFSSICRECLEKTTATDTQIPDEWGVFLEAGVTQDPVEPCEDAAAIWTRFDGAFSTFSALVPIMRKMAEGNRNRTEFPGDSKPWKGWGHGSQSEVEVSEGIPA
jgi:hypothetical protein